MTKLIDLADITADPRAQPRTAVVPEKIAEYVEDMQRGDNFPPLIVFGDKPSYQLADGFHRYYAAKAAERKKFSCDIRQGGLREAILYSCGANAAHGLRRTNADKRRAVAKLLDDEVWSKWSDPEIARHCAVTAHFVLSCRKDHAASLGTDVSEVRVYQTKHGTVSQMQTALIGISNRNRAGSELPNVVIARLAVSLREMERIIDEMPTPALVVENFPDEQRYHFPISKLDQMARWMGELAQLWRENMRESA